MTFPHGDGPVTAFIPSMLLAIAVGFTSTAALIMTQFDATAAMAESDPVEMDSIMASRKKKTRR